MRQRFARALAVGALGALSVLVGAAAARADPSDPNPLPGGPAPILDDFISAQIPALHTSSEQVSQSNVQGGTVVRGGIGMYCQNPGIECRPPGRG